jgi:hypothetical protein
LAGLKELGTSVVVVPESRTVRQVSPDSIISGGPVFGGQVISPQRATVLGPSLLAVLAVREDHLEAYRASEPPSERFSGIAASVRSRFFTMGLARRRDGDWMIIEVGDGQVSGLPRKSGADAFYEALARAWPEA